MAGRTEAMLDYEANMFAELNANDGLLILAKGLGMDKIVLNLLKLYCAAEHLVLVLNTSSFEEEFIISELALINGDSQVIPKVITNDYNASERAAVYLEGGVLFITTRILVVDMLTKRIPIHLISGIVVCRAHKMAESGQVAFILRLFRQDNKTGFIKAISDSPTMFLSGFCQLERVMQILFVKKLFVWPRFHAAVAAVLERHKPDVVELHLTLTPRMNAIQLAILDLLGCCMKDIRKSNPSLDQDELTVENCITKSFDKSMRLAMDPYWHQISQRTKQLLSDVKVLRTLLVYLTQYDCVTFYDFLERLRDNEARAMHHSLWLFMDAASALFQNAKQRLAAVDVDKATAVAARGERASVATDIAEENPKWSALTSVLSEIKNINSGLDGGDTGRVLIAAGDDKTCKQLRELMCHGSVELLRRLVAKSTCAGVNCGGQAIAVTKRHGNKRTAAVGSCDHDRVGFASSIADDGSEDSDDHAGDVMAEDFRVDVISDGMVVIHPLHGNSDPYSLLRTLYDVEPRFVILYDAEMEFVRQIEVFKANRPGMPLRVYFLVYSGSVEEQRYLTNLRREKDAFESIIRAKSTMVIPEERDGKSDTAISQLRDSSKATATTVDSRKAGGRQPPSQGDSAQSKVIVDMREFRSELPSLIHRRGVDIEPVTLEVGDYILTPDICVERKSVSDLIGSLNNGRLYNQAVAMTRYYKRPVLLIEFDQSKAFSLQSKSSLGTEISSSNISSKLSLLTLHFPKLRLIWTHSPYATAEVFEELKANQPEPNRDVAMAMGVDAASLMPGIRYNAAPQDLLMKLPSVNSKNCRFLLSKVASLNALFSLSESELAAVLGNAADAGRLWRFIRNQPSDQSTRSTAAGVRGVQEPAAKRHSRAKQRTEPR